jgi:hypothetical protein
MFEPKPFGHRVHAERVSAATAAPWKSIISKMEQVRIQFNSIQLNARRLLLNFFRINISFFII